MKIKSLKNLNFQRNGVAGECFYHCIITLSDEKGKTFIATFLTEDGSDKNVLISSCRVVCIEQPNERWRGDEFAFAIQSFLNAEMAEMAKNAKADIYDLTINEIAYQQTLTENCHEKSKI